MEKQNLKSSLEAMLMASDTPLGVERLAKVLEDDDGGAPSRESLRTALAELQADYADRGVELVEVASGYRFQTRAAHAAHIARLWDERKPRYSRALLETLALIAYRQPITRGEIEHVRGVAVSSNIMRLLLEREWVRVVGHRDVPGRPSVYATTREFLDYFGLKSLAELPSLAELKDFDAIHADLFGSLDTAAAAAVDMAAADDPLDAMTVAVPGATAAPDDTEAEPTGSASPAAAAR